MLPAADFDSLEVLPSAKTFEAAVAARAEVSLLGLLRCERALPAADFDFVEVAGLDSTFAARLATGLEVTLVAINPPA